MQTSFAKKHVPLLVRVLCGLLTVTIAAVGGLVLITVALMRAMHHKWFRDRIRRFNKEILNPMTLKIAGGPSGIYASIRHVGRRSGREYTTPVVAQPFGDGFVIPLPYEADVDWCHNVLAAGKCTLTWHEHAYPMERPEILQPSEAMKALPVFTRVLYTAGGINQYLWLHQQQEVPEKVVVPRFIEGNAKTTLAE